MHYYNQQTLLFSLYIRTTKMAKTLISDESVRSLLSFLRQNMVDKAANAYDSAQASGCRIWYDYSMSLSPMQGIWYYSLFV